MIGRGQEAGDFKFRSAEEVNFFSQYSSYFYRLKELGEEGPAHGLFFSVFLSSPGKCEHCMNPWTAIPWSKSFFDEQTLRLLCLFQTKLRKGDGLWKAANIKKKKKKEKKEKKSAVWKLTVHNSFVFRLQNVME